MTSYQAKKPPELPDFTQWHKPALDLIDTLLDKNKANLRAGNYPEGEAFVWRFDWIEAMTSMFGRGKEFALEVEKSLIKCDAIAFEGLGTYVLRMKA